MARATAVDHHRIGGSVEYVEVDPLGYRGVPVVDVKGHRAAVRMSQADAVALGQLGLILQAPLSFVPAHGSSARWPLGARGDGHEAPAVPDVRID